MSGGGKELFSAWELSQKVFDWRGQMHSQIDGMTQEEVLGRDLEELADELEERWRVEVPVLRHDEMERRTEEALLGSTSGLRTTFYVPFDGHPAVFNMRPSKDDLPDRPSVDEISTSDELVVTLETSARDAGAVRDSLDRILCTIEWHLALAAEEWGEFNDLLPMMLRQRIEERRTILLENQRFAEALNVPLRRRDDPPCTGFVPTARRRTPVYRPTSAGGTPVPDWSLRDEHYEHILSVLSNMAFVMEKSPKAFSELEEEDLRWHFLFQLNGHYEAGATGETFHLGGKTDILVSWEGRVVFVAECKIWKGAESLTGALDQLRGYTTWRDTKVALLIFSKNANFGAVLGQIPTIVRGRKGYKRDLAYDIETGFRFEFSHPDDRQRKLTVTILAFDVRPMSQRGTQES